MYISENDGCKPLFMYSLMDDYFSWKFFGVGGKGSLVGGNLCHMAGRRLTDAIRENATITCKDTRKKCPASTGLQNWFQLPFQLDLASSSQTAGTSFIIQGTFICTVQTNCFVYERGKAKVVKLCVTTQFINKPHKSECGFGLVGVRLCSSVSLLFVCFFALNEATYPISQPL